jgi:phosphoribosylanthranilate isomerase
VPVAAKICGLNSPETVTAAVAGGARFIGFVFYPPSPRAIAPSGAAMLGSGVPAGVCRVGLFVDPTDSQLAETLAIAALDMLQLHGRETPQRVHDIKERWNVPVMKALPIAGEADVDAAAAFGETADWLLFDAKPPPQMKNALPGGNALSFDWQLLAGRSWRRPWMLSGGLTAANLAEAVRISGARVVDVSSGVEDRPGRKNPARIAEFLHCAATL